MSFLRIHPQIPLAAAVLLLPLAAQSSEPGASTDFGFTGPEIYPIDNGIAFLRHGDVDGDGTVDLVLANNYRSKINILRNRTGQSGDVLDLPRRSELELNELPPDARFQIDSIASEKSIAALDLVDLNSDGRPDVAYYGEPKELIVQYNNGEEDWSLPVRWQITDGQLTPNGLTHGDLNGDGRTDLLLLGDDQIYILEQTEDHRLDAPRKLPFSGVIKSIQALDIDGNNRDDLLLVNWDQANPFRFRLQDETGQLGPEIHFNMPAIHSYWADDLDGDHKTEMITIALRSGRAQIGNFATTEASPLNGPFREGQLAVLPLNRTGKSRRGQLWADIDGNRLDDLLVSEPESGQLSAYLQKDDGSFGPGKTYPTLAGISDIASADWDGDGHREIFLLSQDERQVGVTRLDENGRIRFPEPLPVPARPLVMAVGTLPGHEHPVVSVVSDDRGSRELVLISPDGTSTKHSLSEEFRSNPASMAVHDVDQDGLNDLVILIPFEKLKLLIGKEDGDFDEVDLSPPGGNAEQPWLGHADVDGDGQEELLLAQRNFVRAVVLEKQENGDPSGRVFRVKDQINGSSSQSRITGVTALETEGSDAPTLFLLDAARKVLSLCERDEAGVWQVERNVELPMTDFNGLESVGLGSETPNSVGLLGLNSVAWMHLQGDVWELKQLDGYETPIRDGRLNDVVSGDLNQDGRKDLIFLETAKNHVDLVVFSKEGELIPANRWKVFEQRTFRNRTSDFGEPREAAVVDVTGDGKNDLVLLVHDRVLVYPQE